MEYQLALYEQQQSEVDSLVNVLVTQQALIESLMADQQAQLDSVSSDLQAQIDSLLANQQAQLDSVSSDLQAQIDSLLANQQAQLDSVSSDLLAQIDSLFSMQTEIVDLLINAQGVTETGEDYVRIRNVQICWGEGETNIVGLTEYFPVSFTEPPIIVMNPITEHQIIPSIEDITKSSATFYLATSQPTSFNYQAIGYWL